MVRAPCCEKMGLKKGPWTAEEDQILISYIQKHGHSNWRALPKQAGLLRCGKSCRLRWINYLRPDIKRGNFSKEEEETIIKLHEMLGNRWSTIAAKLPGRTDNEIKNVWHTHLKKRLGQKHDTNNQQYVSVPKCDFNAPEKPESGNSNIPTHNPGFESPGYATMSSPQPSASDNSSVTDNSIATAETNSTGMIKAEYMESWEIFPMIDEHVWSESEVLIENSSPSSNFLDELQFQFPFPSSDNVETFGYQGYDLHNDDGMDFWYNLYITSGGNEELQ